MQCFNKAAKKEVRAAVVLIIAQNKSFKLCTEMGRTEDKLTLLFLGSAAGQGFKTGCCWQCEEKCSFQPFPAR